MTQSGVSGWMPPLFGAVVLQGNGVEATPATTINFAGFTPVWNPTYERLDFIPTGTTTLGGDEDGVATITATETSAADGTLLGLLGSATSPDATEIAFALPDTWEVEDAAVWAIELYAVAKSADAAIRRRIKVSCIVWGDGATATLDAAPVVDELGTGNATATISVSGSTMTVTLQPVDATPLTWRFEVRGQKL
jgi:actin-related protein